MSSKSKSKNLNLGKSKPSKGSGQQGRANAGKEIDPRLSAWKVSNVVERLKEATQSEVKKSTSDEKEVLALENDLKKYFDLEMSQLKQLRKLSKPEREHLEKLQHLVDVHEDEIIASTASIAESKAKDSAMHEWGILGSEEGDYTIKVGNPSPSYLLPSDDEATGPYSYQQIQPLLEFLGFNQSETAELLDVDPSTVTRWKKDPHKTIGKYTSKALRDIDQIIRTGIDIFGNEQQFKVWLQSNNIVLGSIKPIDLLKDPKGINLVNNALAAMGWGNMM